MEKLCNLCKSDLKKKLNFKLKEPADFGRARNNFISNLKRT